MKQFVVIGLGTFGFNLAAELARMGHQVLAIDLDTSIVNEIKERVTDAVAVDVMDRGALSELIPSDLNTVILGLGEQYMEATVLAIVHLRSFGVKNILVKAMNELRGEVYRSVGATEIIYPEQETALRLSRKLTIPQLIEEIPLAPEYSIVEIAIPDHVIGKRLGKIRLAERYGVSVVAVKDVLRDTLLLNPSGEHLLDPDTALVVIGKHADIELLRHFD